MFIQYF